MDSGNQRPISEPIDVSAFIDSGNNRIKMVMYQVLDDTRCNYVITDDAGNLATSSVESRTLHIGKFTGSIQSGDISEIGFDVCYELIPNGDPNQKFKNVSIQFRTIVPQLEEDWGIRLYDLGRIGEKISETKDPDQATNELYPGITFRSLFNTSLDTTNFFISNAKKQFIKLLRKQGQHTLADNIDKNQRDVSVPVLLYSEPGSFTELPKLDCQGRFMSLCSSIIGAVVGAALSPWVIIPAGIGLGAATMYVHFRRIKQDDDKRAHEFTNSQLPSKGGIIKPNIRKHSLTSQLMAELLRPPSGSPPLSRRALHEFSNAPEFIGSSVFGRKRGGKTKRRKNRNKSLKSNSRKYGKYKHNHKRMSRAKSRRRK